MLESDAVGAHDREHTRAVRTTHRGGNKQRHPYRNRCQRTEPTENEINDHTRDDASEQHAQRGQGDTRSQHGFHIAQFGIHSSGKKNDTHRHRTQRLRALRLNNHSFAAQQRTDAVSTEQHTHYQKQQQRRHTELITDFIGYNADKEQQRKD